MNFKTLKNKINIDPLQKTYTLDNNCKNYFAYVSITQWQFDYILRELKQNNFREIGA